jgi:hypothetical protein
MTLRARLERLERRAKGGDVTGCPACATWPAVRYVNDWRGDDAELGPRQLSPFPGDGPGDDATWRPLRHLRGAGQDVPPRGPCPDCGRDPFTITVRYVADWRQADR